MADRLRKARELTGMDQIEKTEYAGISRTSITNYEQGKRTPRGLYLQAWSAATGVPVEWLETGKAPTDDGEGQTVRPPGLEPGTRWLWVCDVPDTAAELLALIDGESVSAR